MKMEFSCQGIEMFSFLTTNMAVTTSHANPAIVVNNSYIEFCEILWPKKS